MDAIQLIYIALFGRPADPIGLDFYSLETDNGNNLDAIGDLTSSAEYQNRFEGQTPQQVITSIYNSLFGRNPDAAGLAFYMAEWQSGRADLESIAIRIAQGATGSDVDTLEAKIEAANAFTAAIDADPDLLAAYQGDAAAAVARAWLAPIDADNPGTASGLDAVLQDLVDAGNAGNTISLTDRIDAPGLDESQPGSGRDTTGTEGNDRYIANAETLQAGDEIDGRGGVDSLELNIDSTLFAGGGSFSIPTYQIDSTGLEVIEVQLEARPDILGDFLTGGLPSGGLPIANIDLLRSDSVTDVGVDQSGGMVSFTNVQNNVDLNLNRSTGIFTVEFDEDALGSDEATFNVNVANTYGLVGVTTNGDDVITEMNLGVEGDAVLSISDMGENGLALETLNVSGSGQAILAPGLDGLLSSEPNPFQEFAGLTTLDASENTGGVATWLLDNEEDVTVTGSSASDILLFNSDAGGGFVTEDDVIDLGAGYDVLGMGGDDLDNLTAGNTEGVDLLALFNDKSGQDYEFEGSDHDFDLALFADFNATLTLDDFDDHTLYLFADQAETINFDDTDVANVTVGLPEELDGWVDLVEEAIDDIGVPSLPFDLSDMPIQVDVATLDLAGVGEGNFVIEGAADGIPNSSLTIGNLVVDDETTTITASGDGDLIIDNITVVDGSDAGTTVDLDDLSLSTYDLTGLTGGFSNSGAGVEEAQTFTLGDIGALDANDISTAGLASYDVDGDGTDDAASYIDLGAESSLALAQDKVVFTADFDSLVVIENFTAFGTSGVQVGEQDILDFTALGVDELTDLTFTDYTGGTGTVITSDAFEGSVLLVGVDRADVHNENFDFIA